MIMNKKIKLGIGLALASIILLALIFYIADKNGSEKNFIEEKPSHGDIKITVSTVGTVEPQNRLEIKPPIGGRIEKIFVKEGQEVKTGDILALMSSTERATLMDAAKLKGKGEFEYWQKVYKETPLVAPIDGVVIVRDVEPGQTVTTSDAVLVLSNRLIVKADMDETDIGEIKVGQKAIVGLDAYPDVKVDAVVDHISYESQIVNNVTIYKVDVLPTEVPEVFRSGMSANVEVIVKEVKNALLVPSSTLIHEADKTMVMVKDPSDGKMKKVPVVAGIESDGNVEIKSGLSDDNVIYVKRDSYIAPKKDTQTNPFLPSFRQRENEKKQ